MRANEWWNRIRAVERAAINGDPQPLHELCEELERLSTQPEPAVVQIIEPVTDPVEEPTELFDGE